MASKGTLNRVFIIGNLGADPELRSLPDGSAVTNFSVATTDTWIDKNSSTGERKELTEWHRVSFFGRSAEYVHQYARKGTKVFVEGALRTRKWTDKDGNDRYFTEIRGREISFLSPRPDGVGGAPAARDNTAAAPPPAQDYSGAHGDDDDIPF